MADRDNAQFGVIQEQGDMGLGFNPVSKPDQTVIEEAMTGRKPNRREILGQED